MTTPVNPEQPGAWNETIVEAIKTAKEDLLKSAEEVRTKHDLPRGAFRMILREALHKEIVREAREEQEQENPERQETT